MNISEKINNLGVVILAAGRGTRLGCEDIPKVMLEIGGKPVVSYVVENLFKVGFAREQISLVVGYRKEKVMDYFGNNVLYAVQEEPLGTAHAAYTGMKVLPGHIKNILVINGDDSAFYKPETIANFIIGYLNYGAMISLLSAEISSSSFSYGRIIRTDNNIEIIEKEYLTEENRHIIETSTGTFCLNRDWFVGVFPNMPVMEKLGEYGLPTAFMMAQKEGLSVQVVKLEDNQEWLGINTKEELLEADRRKKLFL